MARTQAIVAVQAGLSAMVSVGFAARRSPPPVLVADPGCLEPASIETIAAWYGSELIYDRRPEVRAGAEAVARGISRLYLIDPAPAGELSPILDIRTPTAGMTRGQLLAAAQQLKVPLHLTQRCDSDACACEPRCREIDQAYTEAELADPWRVARSLEPSNDSPKATRVHLVGSRFCGSTLLGLLLESHPEIFVAGELDTVSHDFRKRLACTCGVPVNVCGFWASLFADRRSSRVDASNVDSVMDDAARWSGASVVVDSSKRPSWIAELAADPGRRIIHVVRDGRAFLASSRRWDAAPVEQAARHWRETQLAARALTDQFGSKSITVRYEELATNPVQAIADVVAWLDLPPRSMNLDEYASQLSHQVRGNPMRFHRGPVEVDERWKDELSETDLAAFHAIAGDVAELLGYESATISA